MRDFTQTMFVSVMIVLLQHLVVSSVLAHEGYITTYNHHIAQGELEVMLMNDFTSPSDPKRENDGHDDYFSQMLELEYVPTSQLAFEFMMEAFEDIGTGEKEFTGFRYETRYRLFKDEVFLINESDLNNSGETAFGYSLGFLYRLPGQSENTHANHRMEGGDKEHQGQRRFFYPASLAFEFFGALGDTKKFDLQPKHQEHYFQPSIMFHIGENSMFTIGFGIGLTKASDNMVRTSFGWRF